MKHKLLRLKTLIVVALCVIMGMSFTGCSDDDKPADNGIVGTWRLSFKESNSEWWHCQLHFKSGGTLEVKSWNSPTEKEPSSYEAKGTYSISNSFITIRFDGEDEETYRFSLEGNKLIIYDFDEDGPNEFYKV